MPALAEDYPMDMSDLLSISDYVTIRPRSIQPRFKRALTIKLPLPPLESEEFPEDDMVVMEWDGFEWHLHDGAIKFTKSSVMFDTHTLTKYVSIDSCVQSRCAYALPADVFYTYAIQLSTHGLLTSCIRLFSLTT